MNQKQAFGWQSREFLRKKCLGELVNFTINYRDEKSGREYANILLGKENLSDVVIAAGWAEVLVGQAKKDGKVHP
jgi:staphylococcal nuclease domain-containing protein 1